MIWYVGGHSTHYATPKEFYNAVSIGTTYSAKIGLMYVSDYGFAASPSNWTTNMSSYYSATSNNWMYMGLFEWTISCRQNISYAAYYLYDNGFVSSGNAIYNSEYAIRPCFYLKPEVTYVSGDGSQSNPIRIDCPTCTAD